MAGATVTITDLSGKTVTTKADSNGYFKVGLSGMTSPLIASAVLGDRIRYSLTTDALVVGRTATVNITGLTEKIVSDVAEANGLPGAASASPTLVSRSLAAVAASVADMRDALRVQLSRAGLSTATFNPITLPFRADRTGYDGLLDNTLVTRLASGGTHVTADGQQPVDGLDTTGISYLVSEFNRLGSSLAGRSSPSFGALFDDGYLHAGGTKSSNSQLAASVSSTGFALVAPKVFSCDVATKVCALGYVRQDLSSNHAVLVTDQQVVQRLGRWLFYGNRSATDRSFGLASAIPTGLAPNGTLCGKSADFAGGKVPAGWSSALIRTGSGFVNNRLQAKSADSGILVSSPLLVPPPASVGVLFARFQVQTIPSAWGVHFAVQLEDNANRVWDFQFLNSSTVNASNPQADLGLIVQAQQGTGNVSVVRVAPVPSLARTYATGYRPGRHFVEIAFLNGSLIARLHNLDSPNIPDVVHTRRLPPEFDVARVVRGHHYVYSTGANGVSDPVWSDDLSFSCDTALRDDDGSAIASGLRLAATDVTVALEALSAASGSYYYLSPMQFAAISELNLAASTTVSFVPLGASAALRLVSGTRSASGLLNLRTCALTTQSTTGGFPSASSLNTVGSVTTLSACRATLATANRPASGRFTSWMVGAALVLGSDTSLPGTISGLSIQSAGTLSLAGTPLGQNVLLKDPVAF